MSSLVPCTRLQVYYEVVQMDHMVGLLNIAHDCNNIQQGIYSSVALLSPCVWLRSLLLIKMILENHPNITFGPINEDRQAKYTIQKR